MAKLKRIIRKVTREGAESFDDQFWPVVLAFVVLGAFLEGAALGFLRFDDARWYANGKVAAAVIPILMALGIAASRLVNSRLIRRAMQLAIVGSITIHVILMILSLKYSIFDQPKVPEPRGTSVVKARQPVTIPDYAKPQLNRERPQFDFEKPVETTTPAPKPEEIARLEPSPEELPTKPQPTPTPEPQPTVQPSAVQRNAAVETAARASETPSKLSRQLTTAQPRSGSPTATTQAASPATKPAEQIAAASTSVGQAASLPDRKVTAAAEVVPVAKSSAPTEQATPSLAKRETQESPAAKTTASAPTLPRKLDSPAALPRTSAPLADNPAAAKQTDPEAVRPSAVTATRQPIASPLTPAKAAEPAPEKPAEVAAQPQRKQSPAETKPTVAEAPATAPSQVARATTRPSVVPSTVDLATPSEAPALSPKQPTEHSAQTAAVQRKPTEAAVARPTIAAEPTPVVPRGAAATAQRASAADAPATSSAAGSIARTAVGQAASLPSSGQQVSATPDGATPAAATGSAQARATTLAKQNTPGPSATAGKVAPETAASSDSGANGPPAARQPRADAAPAVAQANVSAPSRRASTAALPSASNLAAQTADSQSPAQSADAQPRPSAASVARQTSNSPLATQSRQPLDAPSASTSSQVAGVTAQRAQASSAPSIRPQADPGRSPSRSQHVAAASSPTAVESPALAQSEQGAGQTSAQPSRTALAKGQGGTAGAGHSVNLDRALPAQDSPAQVASGAAQRAAATQNSQPGPALAPSEPARIARAQAGALAPSSTFAATPVEFATDAGAARPSETSASASAALARTSSNAPAGALSAAKGTVDVDLGPTRVVSEGGAGRASGGGQQELNPETQAHEIARKPGGGSPQVSLAATTVADVPAAPRGDGGGRPAVEPSAAATAMVRSDAGGDQPLSGGPASAAERGPTAEISTAEQLAAASVAKTELAEAAPGAAAAGGGNPDVSEEERLKRLARAALAGGAAAPATATKVADAPATSAGEPGGGGQPAKSEPGPMAVAASRGESGGGAPTPAGLVAQAESGSTAETGGGELLASVSKIGRAEATQTAPGTPAVGGGTASVARASAGPALAANTKAANVGQAASLPSSEAGSFGYGNIGQAASLPAPRQATGPVGAAQGEKAVDVASGTAPGLAVGPRQASSTAAEGPLVAHAATSGGPGRRAASVSVATGTSAEDAVNIPAVGVSTSSRPDMSELVGGAAVGPMSREAAGGRVVKVGEEEGPGGLGAEYAPDVGIASRQASRESDEVQLSTARFIRRDVGGPLGVNTSAVVSTDPFRGRSGGQPGKLPAGPQGSPPPQTEEAIELGLQFLARHQSADGRWSLNYFAASRPGYEAESASLNSDTAATGLALLAFEGAGYHHREHKHRETVRAGLEWLVKNQKADGDLYVKLDDESSRSVWLYSHAIGTLALCEAYAMTQDPALKEPAQRALDFIVEAQNPERGGWRYAPTQGSDTSVTGWMMMALKSGELANLEVPTESFVKIRKWLDSAQAGTGEKHLYRYNPSAPNTKEQAHGRLPSKTMTAVGLLMRLYSGWQRDDADMRAGADYLKQNLPAVGTLREPQRDTYYWYYGTYVMFMMGGDHWKAWNDKLHPLLVNSQVRQGPLAGSWHPLQPVPDRWAPHAGRLYVTTMNLLSLEVYYRHLPLYEEGKGK